MNRIPVPFIALLIASTPAWGVGAYPDGRFLVPAVSHASAPTPCTNTAYATYAPAVQALSATADHALAAAFVWGCQAVARVHNLNKDPVEAKAPAETKVAAVKKTKQTKRRVLFPEDSADVRHCVARAAKVFSIELLPLYLILDVEGGTVGKISRRNGNGTYDIGPMQINSRWLSDLGKMGVTQQDLQHNLCINILVGAWIYTQERMRSPNMAIAIARYHSPTKKYQQIYLTRVAEAIVRRQRHKPTEEPNPCPTSSGTCESRSIASSDATPTPSPSPLTPSGT